MDQGKALKALENILAIINDGKFGYQNASDDVSDATLKELFHQYAQERASFAQELKNQITKIGGKASDEGDTLGALHRTWMDIKSTVSGGERDSIITTCITGEEKAIAVFDEEMKNVSQPDIVDLLSQQYSAIQLALHNIRSLERSL